VDGRGLGHGLAKECSIAPNNSLSILHALMPSIHSPAALTSSVITLHRSCQKSWQRDNASAT